MKRLWHRFWFALDNFVFQLYLKAGWKQKIKMRHFLGRILLVLDRIALTNKEAK